MRAEDLSKLDINEVDNILLNMSGGLLPKHLTEDEVELLKEKYGENWFYELGYDDTYEKPIGKK